MAGSLCAEGPAPFKQLEEEEGGESTAVLTAGLAELEVHCLSTDELTASAWGQYLLASKNLYNEQCCGDCTYTAHYGVGSNYSLVLIAFEKKLILGPPVTVSSSTGPKLLTCQMPQ